MRKYETTVYAENCPECNFEFIEVTEERLRHIMRIHMSAVHGPKKNVIA